MAPSSCYIDPAEENYEDEHNGAEEEGIPGMAKMHQACIPESIGIEVDHIPESQPLDWQFFVQPESDCDVSSGSNSSSEHDGEDSSTRRNLFALPQVQSRGHRGSQVE